MQNHRRRELSKNPAVRLLHRLGNPVQRSTGVDRLRPVDRDIGREAAEDLELERKRDDRPLERRAVAVAGGVAVLELADLAPRPGRRRSPGCRGRRPARTRTTRGPPRRSRGSSSEPSGRPRYRPRIKSGEPLKRSGSRRGTTSPGSIAIPADSRYKPGQERRADPAMDGLHDLVEPVFRFDQLAGAAAALGQAAQEPFVHGLIDARA